MDRCTDHRDITELLLKTELTTVQSTNQLTRFYFYMYLAVFVCNTTSDWLNHAVYAIRSCVTFKLTKSWREKDKECS